MNIAFDISPLKSEHQFRGIGFYTKNLIESLEAIDKKNNYYKFNTLSDLPTDINLIHYPYFDLFQRTLKIKKSVKTIVTIHDLTPLVFPDKFPAGLKGKINWLWQKRQLSKVNAIITDSYSSKKDIVKIAGMPSEKVHVVYLAPSAEFRKLSSDKLAKSTLEIRRKYKVSADFILYVGDVNWNKNIFGIIEAYNKLQKTFSDLKLVFVGKAFFENDLQEKKEIDQKIKSLNLENKVIKTGYISNGELVLLYNLAKVYIQPSFYEGFGLPVLEAMSCGMPVVCSNAGSLPEIVGDTGIIIDPNNLNDIVRGIGKVLTMSNEEIEKLRNEGRKQAAKFTWEKTARETRKVYEKVYQSLI